MLAEKYRNFSREKLLEEVYDLGVRFEKFSGSCSQCAVAALHEILGFEDVVVRVATSSCGGHARFSSGTCGAVIGGTMVLDYYFGRPAEMLSATKSIPQGKDALSAAVETAQLLCEKFIRQYGSIRCPQVQECLFGRSFNLLDPDDWQAFEEAGAHSDPTKCMSVVGNAAKWTLEILIEQGAVPCVSRP